MIIQPLFFLSKEYLFIYRFQLYVSLVIGALPLLVFFLCAHYKVNTFRSIFFFRVKHLLETTTTPLSQLLGIIKLVALMGNVSPISKVFLFENFLSYLWQQWEWVSKNCFRVFGTLLDTLEHCLDLT